MSVVKRGGNANGTFPEENKVPVFEIRDGTIVSVSSRDITAASTGSANSISFPLVAPFTHRITTAAGNLVVDNSSGGPTSLSVANILVNRIGGPGDLFISPSGALIDFGNRSLGNISSIASPSVLTGNISSPPLTPSLNYNCTNASGSHIFSINGVENLRANSLALRVSTPITSTGNLVLNPSGPNIDCSGKTLINAVIPINSQLSGPTPHNDPAWTGSPTFRFARTGNICNCVITGNITATNTIISWQGFPIPSGFTPVVNTSTVVSSGRSYIVRLRATTTGFFAIEKVPTGNFTAGEALDFTEGATITYTV